MKDKSWLISIAIIGLVGFLSIGVVAVQAAPSAQTPPPTPANQQQASQPIEGSVAFVPLEPLGESGVIGVAALHEVQGEATEVYVSIHPPSGPRIRGASPDELGEIIIAQGYCDNPGTVTAILGAFRPIYSGGEPSSGAPQTGTPGPNATPIGYGIAARVPMQITTLLYGGHLIAILEKTAEGETADPVELGADLPFEQGLLACRAMTKENMLP
jgi:hypothetical protein